MRSIKIVIIVLCICIISIPSIPQIFHTNAGESISIGTYNKGSLQNSYLLPRKGLNYICHSWFSYYILGREYLHSDVYNTVLETYAELQERNPGRTYVYMESSNKKGGRIYPHRTHQNGLSIDFMSPLIDKNGKPKYYRYLGIFRYALNFDSLSRLTWNSKVSIDCNAMAEHILLLQKHAKKHNLRITKVIFNTNLQSILFATKYGKQLKKSGIYITQNLTPLLNKLHDDHYHVDFEQIKKNL